MTYQCYHIKYILLNKSTKQQIQFNSDTFVVTFSYDIIPVIIFSEHFARSQPAKLANQSVSQKAY